ncbi:MAG: hypothetical protein L3J37_03845 [Rhodobacteraceae bacterium]|nr:hypothetical protein [Paracoccaceae bacterium]
MKIAHISDLHIASGDTFGIAPMAKTSRVCWRISTVSHRILCWSAVILPTTLAPKKPPALAYLLHMSNADGGLITHQITLDDPTGPYAFAP